MTVLEALGVLYLVIAVDVKFQIFERAGAWTAKRVLAVVELARYVRERRGILASVASAREVLEVARYVTTRLASSQTIEIEAPDLKETYEVVVLSVETFNELKAAAGARVRRRE